MGGVARRAVGATILHADLDAFFASVEQRDDPRLRGRPIAVGGGVVLAASYEAKAFGVRTAMGITEARRLCPRLLSVEPRFTAYSEASKAVFEVFEHTSPLVEGLSIDEAFLDVSGLGTGLGHARRRSPWPCAATCGSRSGWPSRSAWPGRSSWPRWPSAVAKPDGLLVVEPEDELAFLHPLPVGRLWGVGPVTAAKLGERAITTVGDVARLPESVLVAILGPAAGRHVHALAHNRDPRPVVVGRRRRSIGSQRALGRRPAATGGDRRHPGLAGRPGDPAHAHRRPGRANCDAPAPLRRLLPGHPLAHAGPGDGPHRDHPDHGEGPPDRGTAA